MRLEPLAASLLLAAALATDASAHEFWLAPSAYRAGVRDTVAVAAWVGTGFRGELKPYAVPRAVRFTLQGARVFDLRPLGANGDVTWARFTTADDGGALIAYESNFTPIELAAPEFDRYLKLEGLDGPLRARAKLGVKAGAGRERYARCPKTWIAGTDLARARRAAGLTIEIVPLEDPAVANPLPVRVLYRGRPLAGTLVRAWTEPLASGATPADGATRDSVGPAFEQRTDAQGVARIRLDRDGEWLLSTVHMVPSADRAVADWESVWASLTFARIRRP